eukprot:523707-Prorocentrum_minimum.AAC.1
MSALVSALMATPGCTERCAGRPVRSSASPGQLGPLTLPPLARRPGPISSGWAGGGGGGKGSGGGGGGSGEGSEGGGGE